MICSIGSLFVGPGAVTNGEQIFEKFNKTLLATVRCREWEPFLHFLTFGSGKARF